MVSMANEETSESREYDAVGRLLATTDSFNGRIDYGYDLLGNRTSMIDPDNGEFSYSYDEKNRLISFTDPEGKVTAYAYDVMGRVISTDFPNTARTVRVYNTDNRLESMIATSDKDGILASFVYTYDNVGNKLTMTEEDGVTSYRYDAAYRLVHVQYPARPVAADKNNGSNKGKGKKKGHQVQALPSSVSYVYDAAGNRLSKTDDSSTVTYSYNSANQLLQAGNMTYAYDANGNRVSKQDEDGSSYYLYNNDNFLVQFNDPEDNVTVYGYDAMNRRVYKSQGDKNQDVTGYLYDGLEVLQEVTGRNAQKITAYYRANGRIITQQKYNVSQGGNGGYQNRPEGRQLFYAYDGLGSVAALSNHQGKLKTRYQYDAFGEVLAGDLSDNPYAFTGKRLDPESGLYHFHFRQYDAEVGIWTTADPIGVVGGVNLYGYIGNNPVNFRDWLGLWKGAGADRDTDIDSEGNITGGTGLQESDGNGSDVFSSQDAAAIAALDDAMPESVRKQEEYGGYICKNPDGSYSYTEPASTGSSTTLNLNALDTPETCEKKTAAYHTHPKGSNRSEFFSMEDNLYSGRYGDLYLGTPRGTVKVTRPGTGPETIRYGR